MGVKDIDIDSLRASILYVVNALGDAGFHKVAKVLYFADQKHLIKYGRSITGDSYVAMKFGPVPSVVYDILKVVRGDGYPNPLFSNIYSSLEKASNYTVKALEEADLDELSISDRECLDESIKENAELSFADITSKSHDSAWTKAWNSGQGSDLMNIMEIVEAGGGDEHSLSHVEEMIERRNLVIANAESE